jgi:hypothetical protein
MDWATPLERLESSIACLGYRGFHPVREKGALVYLAPRSPRQSVQKADELVAAIIRRLAAVFSAEQEKLESNWGTGGDI